MSEHLLENLNPDQQKAVTATEGPVLVLAGAGSGKTRVLTHRLAYIIEQRRARPEELLAVTFTNRAAREMKERVLQLTKTNGSSPTLGTFHSVGARLLREQHHATTRSAGFTIYNTSDSESVIKQALENQGVSPKEWSPKLLRHEISKAKNDLLTPAQLLETASSRGDEIIAATYARYQTLLQHNDAYDFDDLIVAVIALLTNHSAIRTAYQQRWRYISVDEYQDTNLAQERLLQLLIGQEKNICVVGDDYQAIYSWRGAKVDHILRFSEQYPTCATFYLTQNYRSTPAILRVANQVIAQNKTQMHKKLWTETAGGAPVQLYALPSDRAEAAWVRQQIESYIDDGGSAADCAILYRTNAQSRLFEEEFLTHRMPYTIVGGFRFYDRREVKDAMALLQFAANPRATVALRRLANSFLKGIGLKTLQKLESVSENSTTSLLDIVRGEHVLSRGQRQTIEPLLQAYQRAQTEQFASVNKLLLALLSTSGYSAHLKKLPDGQERWENIEELCNVAALYTVPQDFIAEVALMSDIDELKQETERITCMTLHAAKGLEFPYVYIAGLEEGLFPHVQSIDTVARLEEERRLLYVGLTRAQKGLRLTFAHTRLLRGEFQPQLPSRFIENLPDSVEHFNLAAASPMLQTSVDTLATFGVGIADTTAEPVQVVAEIGEFVLHPTFGRGVVIQNRGSVLTCVFPEHGVKTIDGTTLSQTA